MNTRLPDFIIGGAPKSATSSIHRILDDHSDVGIPQRELHFFDADDPITHPAFFIVKRGELLTFDCDSFDSPLFSAYREMFAPFQDRRLIGEDSTSYLYSDVAPSRIKRILPQVKLIFMLRDPVERAYSQYWHLVGTARATTTFERALTAWPAIVLGSTYARNLSTYFELFGRDRVKVLLFEDFIADTQGVVDSVTDFIGASRFQPTRSWSNKTHYPRSLALTLALNRIGSKFASRRYRNHLGAREEMQGAWAKRADFFWRRQVTARSLGKLRPPPMRQETREYLTRHMSERNRGLSKMLGRDLGAVWPGFAG